jgi:hypothetical protein
MDDPSADFFVRLLVFVIHERDLLEFHAAGIGVEL